MQPFKLLEAARELFSKLRLCGRGLQGGSSCCGLDMPTVNQSASLLSPVLGELLLCFPDEVCGRGILGNQADLGPLGVYWGYLRHRALRVRPHQ